MLPLPTFPSDNLYKFVALFGLAVFILSSYQVSVLWEENFQLSQNLAPYEADTYVASQAATHRQQFGSPRKKDSAAIAQDTYTFAPLDTVALRRQFIASSIKHTITKNRSFLVILYLIIMGAAWMIVYGFNNWYNKVQKFQDEVLAQEARERAKS